MKPYSAMDSIAACHDCIDHKVIREMERNMTEQKNAMMQTMAYGWGNNAGVYHDCSAVPPIPVSFNLADIFNGTASAATPKRSLLILLCQNPN